MTRTGRTGTWLAGTLAVVVSQGCLFGPLVEWEDLEDRQHRTLKDDLRSDPRETGRPPAPKRESKWTAQNAGPRVGLIHVGGEAAEVLEAEFEVDPLMSAWGWQFDLQYAGDDPECPTALIEVVPFVLGLEQGQGFPSLNVLCGLRTHSGWEFGVGPNVSPSGIGLTVAIGRTFQMGKMSLPVNVAFVSGELGQRYSLTFGWNLPQ